MDLRWPVVEPQSPNSAIQGTFPSDFTLTKACWVSEFEQRSIWYCFLGGLSDLYETKPGDFVQEGPCRKEQEKIYLIKK